jgi:hypothetical protein
VDSFAFSDPTCAAQGEPGSVKQEWDPAPWHLVRANHEGRAARLLIN